MDILSSQISLKKKREKPYPIQLIFDHFLGPRVDHLQLGLAYLGAPEDEDELVLRSAVSRLVGEVDNRVLRLRGREAVAEFLVPMDGGFGCEDDVLFC